MNIEPNIDHGVNSAPVANSTSKRQTGTTKNLLETDKTRNKPRIVKRIDQPDLGLETIYACVTMIDVGEGDCYVVDLRDDPKLWWTNPKAWRRLLIDTGKDLKIQTRCNTICDSLFGKQSFPFALTPWTPDWKAGDGLLGGHLPHLSGIMITHSDTDHAGGANAVIERLRKLPVRSQPVNKIPILMSPMWLWTDDIIRGIMKDGKGWGSLHERCNFTVERHLTKTGTLDDIILSLSFDTRDAGLGMHKSWRSLHDLAFQAKYNILCRFNLVQDADKLVSSKEAFTAVDLKRLNLPNDFLSFRPTRRCSLRTLCKLQTVVKQQATSPLLEKLQALIRKAKSKLLIEVVLRPHHVGLRARRTLPQSSYTQNDISGHWLRTAIDLKVITDTEPGKLNVNAEKSVPGFQLGHIPEQKDRKGSSKTSFDPSYRIVGLRDELYPLPLQVDASSASLQNEEALSDDGLWSSSRYGCAGSEYVRDFAHFILQYKLPQPIQKKKKKAANSTGLSQDPPQSSDNADPDDEDEQSSLDADELRQEAKESKKRSEQLRDLYGAELPVQSHWAEYANRASIITHFVYTDNSKESSQHRAAGTGHFNMLFTGDAFEAGLNETTVSASRKLDLASTFAPLNLNRSLHVPDGNILAWLWEQNLLSSFKVDVLKVPHHGSSKTTSSSFFRTVSASVYLISASATLHNHPRPETIQTIMATIRKEDGPAESPRHYGRLGKLEDGDKTPIYKVSVITSTARPHLHVNDVLTDGIDQRPRPRLIFMTHCANLKLEKKDGKLKQKARTEAQKRLKDEKPAKLESRAKKEVEKHKASMKRWEEKVQKLAGELIIEEAGRIPDFSPKKAATLAEQRLSASDWLRTECIENRVGNHLGLVNARFFYQKIPNAATRLTFGRDSYRPNEVRVVWNPADWVEMRDEWDAYDEEESGKQTDSSDGASHPQATPLYSRYTDPMDDPLAYPLPDNDAWERYGDGLHSTPEKKARAGDPVEPLIGTINQIQAVVEENSA